MAAESYVQTGGVIWSRTDAGWEPRQLGGEGGDRSNHRQGRGAPRKNRMDPDAALLALDFYLQCPPVLH